MPKIELWVSPVLREKATAKYGRPLEEISIEELNAVADENDLDASHWRVLTSNMIELPKPIVKGLEIALKPSRYSHG